MTYVRSGVAIVIFVLGFALGFPGLTLMWLAARLDARVALGLRSDVGESP